MIKKIRLFLNIYHLCTDNPTGYPIFLFGERNATYIGLKGGIKTGDIYVFDTPIKNNIAFNITIFRERMLYKEYVYK